MKINQISFVDLYLGDDFVDITGLAGAAERVPAPAALADDIKFLRDACRKQFMTLREEEFSLNIEGTIFRVTQYQDVTGKDIFTLRRSAASIRPMSGLGFGTPVLQLLMAKDLRGLVLVAGEMASGKTSTAATVMVERLKAHGGIGMAIEDPPETALNGVHGIGRCIQVPVSRRRGGYKEMLTRAMRSGARNILVGEIRDDDTAIEALRASINGHLILSTIHAGSISQAIERLQTFCLGKASNTNSILAEGLSMVVWQSLETVPAPPASPNGPPRVFSRLKAEFLVVRDQNGVKAKIREGKIDSLHQDVKEQATKLAWTLANSKANNGVK